MLTNLEMKNVYLSDVCFGEVGTLNENGKALSFNPASLVKSLKRFDNRIKDIRVHIVKPGESTRIICVKDVLEARLRKGEGKASTVVRALKNMAIVTSGQIVAFQEGIIDMSGPGAEHTPFSKTINIVLEIDVIEGLTRHQHEEAIRLAGLHAATILGQISLWDNNPDEVISYNFHPENVALAHLPKAAYVYMLLSQGLLHDNYVFRRNAREKDFLPLVVSPLDILYGAIVSGNCVSACDKTVTWLHQNNPVILELLKRHGKDLNFVGVVLTNELTDLAGKKASVQKAIELVKRLGAERVVITEEGFGNPEADLMMLIRDLEQAGIRTVALTDEYAGSDGASQSLADTTPEAKMIISVGNANERIILPPMKKIIGPIQDLTKLAGAYPQSLRPDGSLEIELQGIIGATNQLGWSKLTCKEV
ncbi:MAG: glycine/sarcosine/betaine reductase component B subunit [Candidatus Portnoybacteria bacterium]|nr:glycine/sarcosine/betaine reductase component B subunit [Candidatus Portnoybacteria bacterium]